MLRKKPKKEFNTTWAFEPFDRDPTFFQKRMFGCLGAYVHGRMVMVLSEDPGDKSYRGKSYSFDIWDGILLPTERVFHESLMHQFPALVEHPVLGKWLYLPAQHDDFENVAVEIARLIAQGDKRFGVDPKIRIGGRGKKSARRYKRSYGGNKEQFLAGTA
ncbi:MAG: hypothetical protein NC930_00355 [Candidatus Omnitrophica bacterium]|nr:hypothetical protein [Candidatus Omnitrophota bacterium]